MNDFDRVKDRWKGVSENRNLINKYLHYIVINPNDVNYSIDSSNEGEEGKFIIDNTKVHTGKLKFTVGMPKST